MLLLKAGRMCFSLIIVRKNIFFQINQVTMYFVLPDQLNWFFLPFLIFYFIFLIIQKMNESIKTCVTKENVDNEINNLGDRH